MMKSMDGKNMSVSDWGRSRKKKERKKRKIEREIERQK